MGEDAGERDIAPSPAALSIALAAAILAAALGGAYLASGVNADPGIEAIPMALIGP